jgi:bifunctional non-homologous end joining protein LigD
LSLKEYERKRDFAKTPEPAGGKRPRSASMRFVVQKHDATRLHYDFRLETPDGVLASWAVPKGPSPNPRDKRLAIQTEDHPLDYIDFEGEIPEGNYGAGTVIVWDTGTYTSSKDVRRQIGEGKITVNLHGSKIKGAYSLVRMNGGKNWLLTKSRDEYASERDLTEEMPQSILAGNKETLEESEFPKSVKPMLALPVDEPFDKKDWVFEVKWDGVRAITFLNKDVIEIHARSGRKIAHRYPEIAQAIGSAISCNSAVLDGEIVVLKKQGVPDFQRHQKRMNVDSKKEIEFLASDSPATYFVFDILHLDGKNLEGLDFIERRKVLTRVIKPHPRVRVSDYIEGDGKALFESAVEKGLEGIIAKYKYGKYWQGARSSAWLKVKGIMTQDCVVIGYTRGEGNREEYFGSLILAAYHNGRLRFVGHSGSGFGFDQLQKTFDVMQKLRTDECPVQPVPVANREPVWLKLQLVAEVKFNGWTKDGMMRAPIFVRFREDKLPNECTIEQARDTDQVVSEPATEEKFGNLDKVFFPSTPKHKELTKKDLVAYYESVSKYLVPHLCDRPLSLKRYPDGIGGKSFYHKNWSQARPDYAKTIQVFSETRGGVINYLICNNMETLRWLANLGCIEMHPWYSRVHDFSACSGAAAASDSPGALDEDRCGLGTPDFVVFDLDPYIYSGKEAKGEEPEYNTKGFEAALDVALDLKDLLDELRIESYIKTSGKTGLHVFVPVAPAYTYDQTRDFAEIIGRMLDRRKPGRITMEWDVSKRKGKVFFDHNQNARGKTLASIFSVRPTPAATVSMPVAWKALPRVKPTDFTMINVPGLLAKKGDPWRGILQKRQDLGKILEQAA